MNSENLLPENVREALAKGQKIEAIKLLREATGIGLKEAKDIVENKSPVPDVSEKLSDPASVAEALQKGNKIEAIKRLREQTGMGLKDAKGAVEEIERETGISGTRSGAKISSAWILIAVTAGMILFYLLHTISK
jgi:ribosomal protein L7/L12